jgi:hypothetical protein
MASKKPYSRHTNPADRKIDEGALVPGIQTVVAPEPDAEKGALVPGIQVVTQPPTSDQPAGDIQTPNTQPSRDSEPSATNQPVTDTPKPETSGTESSK